MDFVDFPPEPTVRNPLYQRLDRRFEVMLSSFPDYLVYTHVGQRHRLYSCTKIFYTPEVYPPDWRECDYALTSIKVDDPRAFHLPYYSLWRESAPLVRPPGVDWPAVMREKTGFCSFLAGYADRSVRFRTEFFQRLSARQRVDSGGRALNNLGRRIAPGLEAKLEFLRSCKFHLAFENGSIPGYVSEKIVDAFAARTVPIYWGDPGVKGQFNPEAFIDRNDFSSDEACIEHVLRVHADDALYLKYLAAPPFVGNRPNQEWDQERLLDFFENLFLAPPRPVARRRWYWTRTKWRLAKRLRTHEEMGAETAEDRHRKRLAARDESPPASGTGDAS